MGDPKIDREQFISWHCVDSSLQKDCSGYIDQCIEQKQHNVSDYMLVPEEGDAISAKHFGDCISKAEDAAKRRGRPAESTITKTDSTDNLQKLAYTQDC